MTHYRNATMEVFKPDIGGYQQPCQVRFDKESIRVEYDEDGLTCAYSGKAKSEGHYELTAEGFQGGATLHTFPDSIIFEGFWKQDVAYGMWRIRLDDQG